MSTRCLFCGRRPVEWHHLTGRLAPDGCYLDPALVLALCKRHHDREHELLRRAALEFPSIGSDLTGHRLARLLSFLRRCGDHGKGLIFEPATPYGSAVEALALLVHGGAAGGCALCRSEAS